MNLSKTLYVSDLDGTLLKRDQTISKYTATTINQLVTDGMIFSYATARSNVTASVVAKEIAIKIPVIVYNGALILDNVTQQILVSNYFTETQADEIFNTLTIHGIFPMVYSHIDGVEKYSYNKNNISHGMQYHLDCRKGDIRDNPLEQIDTLGKAFYFACIDNEEKLRPVYEIYKDKYQCIYGKDIYSGAQWLEIMPLKATKSEAILQLKKLLNCDKVIVFGDGINDICMFNAADECYAVANAAPELIAIATAVIEKNDSDGVARWLNAHVQIK